jgi:hypothetical protein
MTTFVIKREIPVDSLGKPDNWLTRRRSRERARVG